MVAKVVKVLVSGRGKSELLRLGVAVGWFLLCGILMAVVQMNGDTLHARHMRGDAEPLLLDADGRPTGQAGASSGIYDVVFNGARKIADDSIWNPDVFLHTYIVVSIVGAVVHWPLMVLVARARRFFFLFGLGYLLRALALLATVLPPSNPTCIPIERSFLQSLLMIPLVTFGGMHTCTDKLYSGHTTTATLLTWFWIDARRIAGDRAVSFWKLYAVVHAVAMCITSVLGWNHYTVDIVLAAIVNTLTYMSYTYLALIRRMAPLGGGGGGVREGAPLARHQILLASPVALSTVAWLEAIDLDDAERASLAMEACEHGGAV